MSHSKQAAPADNPLKIAYVFQGNGRFFDWKAHHVHIFYSVRSLQDRGHEAYLLSLSGKQVLFTNDLASVSSRNQTVRHVGKMGILDGRLFSGFESAIRRMQRELRIPYLALFDSYRMYDACVSKLKDFDIYHERINLLAVGGALANRRLGIPYILEVNADMMEQYESQGIPVKGLRRVLSIWEVAFCLKSATRIIAVSLEQKAHLVDKWGVDGKRIDILPCAADTSSFGKEHDPRPIRSQLGLSEEQVVMWVGGFYAWHNLEMLLQSFGKVLIEVPDAKLVLVGDGKTRSRVTEAVAVNGLRDAVIFTGRVAHDEVAHLLSIADIAVSPSTRSFAGSGGTPLKLFEYMAAGKAIIAGSMSQNSRVIDDGKNGLLVDPEDPEAFARAIVSLLKDPEERKRLGRNSRERAERFHSWTQYGQMLEEVYRSAISETLA